jgi:hypothetical protein
MTYNPCNTEFCKSRCDSYAVHCEQIAIEEVNRLLLLIEALKQSLQEVKHE